jgi:hypothetical protein
VALAASCIVLLIAAPAVRAAPQLEIVPIEPIEPDRPDVTNGTRIVGPGLLQLEFGGLYTRRDATTRSSGFPLTIRLGVFDWLEVRLGSDGFVTQNDGGGFESGIGNTQVGAKLRLWADPGGLPVLSVLPAVNLPTANSTRGLGSGSPDYTIAVLTGTDLGRHAHVDINYGIGSIGSGPNAPHFTQHLVSLSLSDAISDNWNPYVEGYWFSRQDAGGRSVTAIDAGAIYQIGTRYALDCGVQFGVTAEAPGFAAFGGLSIIVGNVLGNFGAVGRQRQALARAAARSSSKQ